MLQNIFQCLKIIKKNILHQHRLHEMRKKHRVSVFVCVCFCLFYCTKALGEW